MTVTTSNLKQNFHLLDEAKHEPIFVTRRGKPYVVVLDHEAYQQLKHNNANNTRETASTLRQKIDLLLKQRTAFDAIDDPVAWQRRQRNAW